MKTKPKFLRKSIGVLMVLITIISTFFSTSTPVHASDLVVEGGTGYKYTGISPFTGQMVTHDPIYFMKVDGKMTFCIESGIMTWTGGGYVPEEYVDAKRDVLSKIAYYGYTNTARTGYDYAVTQIMIWEEIGDTFISTTVPNYQGRKAEIMAQVNRHDTLPSFTNQTVNTTVGETVTITDTNDVLRDMDFTSNSTNSAVSVNGNTITITPNANSNDGSLGFQKVPNGEVGTSIVYRKPDKQSLVEFHMESSKQASLNVNVIKLGNVKALKIDEDTGKPLANAKLKFEYNGTSKEVVTGSDGIAQINDIVEGTTVTITEVTAPNGYFNKGEIKKLVIKPNETISVTLNNKEQLGQVLLAKSGADFGSTMFNKYYSLEGAVYGIYTETGSKVGTMTTDKYGKAISTPIKLGKYYALEEKAPNGYLLNKEKIPFELKYAGQTIEITSTSIAQKDKEQKGSATLVKEDSKTGSIPQGGAKLDGAVYELRRTSNDEVVGTVTIKDGKGKVDNLYLDDYYWIETKAPEGYLIDEEKHPFTLKYAGQNVETAIHSLTVKETVITGGFDLVKFGNYDWKTNLANLFSKDKKDIKPLKDVEFSVYSDTTGKLVQKGLTDKEGYLKFTDLPYDSYTVKETKTPEGYEPAKDFTVTIREQNETHHYAVENKVIEEKLKVVKVDAETGKTIPRADAGFQIKSMQTSELVSMPKFNAEGETVTFFTNSEGYLMTPETLSYGDYELIEVQAPVGYVLAKEPMPFKVDGSNNGLIEIRFEDMSQKGIALLSKTGQTPIDVKTTSSDYGDLYEFIYDYTPLAGVTYDIEAVEDIITNDETIRAKKGDVVATVTTDDKGEWVSPELYLGKYQAIETKAPEGFVIDPTPIPFELKYAGQTIELTSTSLTDTNDFQKLAISLFKNQEVVIDWKDNEPVIDVEKGNQKVFGIFTREAQSISDELKVPENALVGYEVVTDGKASFDMKLPQGKYYLKEVDAGSSHVPSDAEYDFEFKAVTNNDVFPIHVYEDTALYGKQTLTKIAHQPIVNQLHFNDFSLKKVNETATLKEKDGYEFTFDSLGTGAVFTLEDEAGTMIQEVTIDESSKGVFKQIPVGTFYLKEKQSSSEDYVLLDSVIRIESTKDGITAYDEENKLIGEQPAGENPTILFELENKLVKGNVELTKKDVSTGELLPDTGVRILDKDKNVIIEDRTNDKGIFTFEQLPKGSYYFQEFDAPEGYELDETPMPFEIKENGEVVKCDMTNKKIPEKMSLPQTGDSTNIALFVAGVVLSAGALLFILKKKKSAQ